MYQIVALGTPYVLENLKKELTGYPTISFLSNEGDVDETYPHLYLYYGQTKEDANYHGNLSLDKIVKDMSILPIVKDVKTFGDVIPKDLATINALELSDITELPKLKNFILSYFGNLDGNKKIFISYKRDDTGGLAMQLYDALSKAGYIPFLDSYSIEPIKPFQEYLKHELSDSEMMLFLNSPNFDDSKYTMEELNTASELGVGIVQLRFDNCAIKKEADISEVVYMGQCKPCHECYDEAIITEIVNTINGFRASAFEQRRKSLIHEFRKRKSGEEFIYGIDGYLLSKDEKTLIHPLPRIPNARDFQHDEEKCGKRRCSILYNGMYCRTDIQGHLQWLNSKSQTTECVDLSNLEEVKL